MSDTYAQIARQAALRLADTMDPRLPQHTEAALQEGGRLRQVETFMDAATAISLASLLVSVAQLAWTICQDVRKKGSEPRREHIIRTVHVKVELPQAISYEDRQRVEHVIEVVVDESIEHDGRHRAR